MVSIAHTSLLTHSDTVRQLETNREARDELLVKGLTVALGNLLLDVAVHVVAVHLLDGELVALVLDAVAGDVGVAGEADALVDVVGGLGGGGLDFGGPGQAHVRVHLQRRLDVAVEVLLAEQDAQRRGVLDGHARALALVRHHGVRGVAQDGHAVLVHVGVGVVDPETPGLDLDADGEVITDALVELGVRGQQVLDGKVLGAPSLRSVVALLAGEEAVVRQELATVAGTEHDLVKLALLATPVLEGAVFRVVGKSQADGILGHDVGVEAAGRSRTLLGVNTDDATDCRADTVGTDNEVVYCCDAIFKLDLASLQINVFALFWSVSVLSDTDSEAYLVVDNQLGRDALSLFLERSVLEHGVHVLTVEHPVHVSPALLVVGQVIDTVRLAGVPVTADELLQKHRVSLLHVDSPLLQPSRAVGCA